MEETPIERFRKGADYLHTCYDAWMSVLDNYDQVLRTIRRLTPDLPEEMLRDFKANIERKRQELDDLLDNNTRRLQSGCNVQETQPLAIRIDFSLHQLLRTAWPPPVELQQPAAVVPPEKPSAGPPPGFSFFREAAVVASPQPNFLEIASNFSKGEAPAIFSPQPNFRMAAEMAKESHHPFMANIQQRPQETPAEISDLDDFDTFGTFRTIEPANITEPISKPIALPIATNRIEEASFGDYVSFESSEPKEEVQSDEADFQTMRCVDFLAAKIKQKNGEFTPVALSKVYGHLSTEPEYRKITGNLQQLSTFLGRYPQYFQLSSDCSHVSLVADATSKSEQAVKMAELKMKSAQVAKSSIVEETEVVRPSVAVSKRIRPAAKSSLLKMGNYSSDDEDSDIQNKPISDQSGGGNEVYFGNAVSSLDDFDMFHSTPSWSQEFTKVKPAASTSRTSSSLNQTSKPSSNRSPMGYWDIVDLVITRLNLQNCGSLELAKQISVEAVKMAMQSYDSNAKVKFGELGSDDLVEIVRNFVSKAHELVKRKQGKKSESGTTEISQKMLSEWKYKTMLCTDFTANGRCPRGSECHFAHGPADQRPRRRTRMCVDFEAGNCRRTAYDCHHAHGSEFLGTVISSQEMLPVAAAAPEPEKVNLVPAPAPSSSFWKSTKTTFSAAAIESSKCAICLGSMLDSSKVKKLNCGHVFHSKCIEGWLNKGGNTCPECRHPVIDDNEFPSLG